MAVKDSLISLHRHEELIRADSLEAIKRDAALSDHLDIVGEAMSIIYAFAHDHIHGSDDELTLQYLGIRLFNAAGASVKLALSGYYQKAFVHLRDIIETYFLVDYLREHPEKFSSGRMRIRRSALLSLAPEPYALLLINGMAIAAASGSEYTT